MNLTGVTYSFGSFGIRIRTLYGLLPFCTIPKERIMRLYTHKASMNFLDSLGRAYSGWQLGNRFSRTALVVETDMFFSADCISPPKTRRRSSHCCLMAGTFLLRRAPA